MNSPDPQPAAPAPAAAVHSGHRFYGEDMMIELGQHLITQGLISPIQIEELNSRKTLTGQSIDQMLREEGLVEEPVILQELSRLSGIPFKSIGDYGIDEDAVKRVTSRTALRHRVMPLTVENGVMTLATANVPELATVDGLRMILDVALDWVLCTESDVAKTLTHFYGLGAETIDQLIAETDADEVEAADISAASDETGMVRFINMIISEAIRMDATDIHLEPFEDRLRLRYRIDGILQEIPLPKGVERLKRAVSSAAKIMANMDIAERRKPHDGRIRIRRAKEEFDLRVSVLPTGYGETVNMRILNRDSMLIDLEALGLSKNQLPKIRMLTEMPHGVILLTGPTGSGKTTTLYALLSRINNADVKIITVEDPIEYQMYGISQVQVHSKIDLTFASVLRSILRHDPDVVLIGEIRDSETADIAVRASLTGHLVFSTLHTNDAPSAITRLADMGIEPYLISSCLLGVIAQRLVRRVCRKCGAYEEPSASIRAEVQAAYPDHTDDIQFMHGAGCPVCNFTGYRGRTAINEVMIMNDDLRAMVVSQQPANLIKNQALRDGMVALRADGWLRVIDGRTSVEEVLRVAGKIDEKAQ